MSEAPETIWVGIAYGKTCGVDWSTEKAFQQDTEYRRTDLPPTTARIIADPRVAELVEALERSRNFINGTGDRPMPVLRQIDAALAQIKEGQTRG